MTKNVCHNSFSTNSFLKNSTPTFSFICPYCGVNDNKIKTFSKFICVDSPQYKCIQQIIMNGIVFLEREKLNVWSKKLWVKTIHASISEYRLICDPYTYIQRCFGSWKHLDYYLSIFCLVTNATKITVA